MLFPRLIQKILVFSVAIGRRGYSMACVGACGPAMETGSGPRYLSSAEAAALDQELFTEYKYSVDQLMELAGLSVAVAVSRYYPLDKYKRVLVVCGPGNNGGDGLVAARHLALFGYSSRLLYPRRTDRPLYHGLLHQCTQFNITQLEDTPSVSDVDKQYDVVVDALFGFSFKPPVRDALKPALELMINTTLPVCSVDVPSGWDVDSGPPSDGSVLRPALLVSLSAPKLCARHLTAGAAVHVLGGRFLPPAIVDKYRLNLPQYPGQEQIVAL